MANKDRLRSELDRVVEKLNNRNLPESYEYEIGKHSSGVAVDISRNGEGPHKVLGQFGKAVANAGYIITGTSAKADKTRLFLHEAAEFFNAECVEGGDDADDAEGGMDAFTEIVRSEAWDMMNGSERRAIMQTLVG